MKRLAKAIALLCCVCAVLSVTGCFDVQIKVTSPTDAGNILQQSGLVPVENPSAPQEMPSAGIPEQTTASEFTTAAPETQPVKQESTTAKPKTEKKSDKTPDQLDNEALLGYFNDVVNRVKTEKPGFKKEKLTSILDLQLSNSAANSVVGLVKSALLSEETEVTDVVKGQDCTNVMSPSGATFVSRMNLGDIDKIECEKSGSDYIITAYVVAQSNPEKTSGVMSDVFDFATVDDVMNVYAPKVGATVAREDVALDFSECYAKLTVGADGNVKNYETYVKGVMNMKNASIKKVITISTDVAVTLASRTEYSGFTY